MTASIRRIAGAAALLAAAASPALAQTGTTVARPVSFGITGGLTIPTGDFGDAFDSGFNAGAVLEFSRPASPVAFRINGEYQRFNLKNEFRVGDADNTRIISGTADVLYKFSGAAMTVRPYVLGGVGLFNLDLAGDNTDSETKFGYNLGAGLEIPLSGITVFGDLRFQSIQTEGSATNLLPIRVGLRF